MLARQNNELRVQAGERNSVVAVAVHPGNQQTAERASLSEAKVGNQEVFKQLKGLFFQRGGKLRHDIRSKVDFGPKHGFMRFEGQDTKDERWFMPLIAITKEERGK